MLPLFRQHQKTRTVSIIHSGWLPAQCQKRKPSSCLEVSVHELTRPPLLASLPWSPWNWKNECKRPTTIWTLFQPRSVCHTHLHECERHKASWYHPRSKHWHHLDFVLTRREQLNAVRITRAFHSADCDTDHALIISKIKITPKRTHISKTGARRKISIDATIPTDEEKRLPTRIH